MHVTWHACVRMKLPRKRAYRPYRPLPGRPPTPSPAPSLSTTCPAGCRPLAAARRSLRRSWPGCATRRNWWTARWVGPACARRALRAIRPASALPTAWCWHTNLPSHHHTRTQTHLVDSQMGYACARRALPACIGLVSCMPLACIRACAVAARACWRAPHAGP